MPTEKHAILLKDFLSIMSTTINGTFSHLIIKVEGKSEPQYSIEVFDDAIACVQNAMKMSLDGILVKSLSIDHFTKILTIIVEMPEKIDTIHEWPNRDLYVADILKNVDGKVELYIYENDGEGDLQELYSGRAEYLQWTREGTMDKLGLRKISSMDAGSRVSGDHGVLLVGILMILKDEEKTEEVTDGN